ncbi:hypothetical protein [Streptomyces sp. NPDC050504]|uniref:hypothetical protein n=1 Tax=Streptomyces sp. NPDC050504 TaxID=3365618 RepID=UPI0037B904CE
MNSTPPDGGGPPTAPPAFPPRPLRDVVALYAFQSGCPADFARVTLDFEPWEEGLAYEVAATHTVRGHVEPGELAEFHEALVEGVREELAVALDAGTAVAAMVVLHDTRIHEVDSKVGSFREAGRRAVRRAVLMAYGPK